MGLFQLFGFGDSIGIDLGTATILVYVKGQGIVIREPSVVAVEQDTGTILAVGQEARRMLGKTPGNIAAIRPLREGVISDYEMTERMLKYFITKAIGKTSFVKPTIAVCVPSAVTEVEKRAVEDAARQAGGRKVYVIEEPMAAAIGAGIDTAKACGSMVVDIGGGTTDIAVISLGGIVVSDSIKVAGDNFDEALIRYIKKKHNMLIGKCTAEEIKKQAEIQLSAGTLQWQFIDGGNTRKWTAYQTDQNETHRYTLLLYRQKETYQIDLIYQYQYTNRGDLLSSDHMEKMICATKGLFSSEYIIFSCIEGHSNDKLIKSVRKKTDQMMKELEAQQVDFVDEGTFVSIAAYTDHWESTFSSAEKKLNMQLAFRIGERETKWFFGTPLLLE